MPLTPKASKLTPESSARARLGMIAMLEEFRDNLKVSSIGEEVPPEKPPREQNQSKALELQNEDAENVDLENLDPIELYNLGLSPESMVSCLIGETSPEWHIGEAKISNDTIQEAGNHVEVELVAQIEQLKAENCNLRDQLKADKLENTTVKSKYRNLTHEFGELKSNHCEVELAAQIEQLKVENDNLRDQFKADQLDNATVKSKYRTLKHEYGKLKSDHVELSKAFIKKSDHEELCNKYTTMCKNVVDLNRAKRFDRSRFT